MTDAGQPDDGWVDTQSGLTGRWGVTSRRRRVGLVVAGVALVLAAGLGVRAGAAEPRTITRTVTAAAHPAAPTLDATGCPTTATCTVTTTAIAGQRASVADHFPSARLLASTVTTDDRTRHIYRTLMIFSLSASDTLTVWSQSVPGTPTSLAQTAYMPRIYVDLGGDVVVQSRLTVVRSPAGSGSSVTVETDTTGRTGVDDQAAAALAGDPGLRLS